MSASGHVVVVRPLVVAPAHVEAELLRRHVGRGLVQGLHVQARHRPERGEVEACELDVAAHGEVRAVDLEREPRARHRLVLVAHGLGDGEEVALVVLVVRVVEEERDDAGRGRAEEALAGAGRADRRLQVVGVYLRGLAVAHGDGAVARGGLPARAAGVAEHPARKLREVGQVLVGQRVARSAESGETVLHVGRVARLGELAVADDVHAALRLGADDLADRGPDARGEGAGVHGHAFLAREHGADEVGGARQAAGVGGQDALDASLHPGRPPDAPLGAPTARSDDTPARRGRRSGRAGRAWAGRRGGGRGLGTTPHASATPLGLGSIRARDLRRRKEGKGRRDPCPLPAAPRPGAGVARGLTPVLRGVARTGAAHASRCLGRGE